MKTDYDLTIDYGQAPPPALSDVEQQWLKTVIG